MGTYSESYGDEVLEVGPFFGGCCSHGCWCSASAAKEALIEENVLRGLVGDCCCYTW
jgi:hypothetical protein